MAEYAKAFALGWPAVNPLLPVIYRYWLQVYNLRGSFEAAPVDANALPRFLADIKQRGFCGGTISQPHKEAAFALTAKPSDEAKRLKAVNHVWLEGDVLCGGNSDASAFLANLDSAFPGWSADYAVVLGAGYAARVALCALAGRGCRSVFLAARTAAQAEETAAFFKRGGKMTIKTGGLEDVNAHLPEAALAVNTGMLGPQPAAALYAHPMQEDSAAAAEAAGEAMAALLPFGFMDFHRLPAGAIAADIVYSPQRTVFLLAASAAGIRAVNGLGMLLYQAAPGFVRWFGEKPQIDKSLRDYVAAQIPA